MEGGKLSLLLRDDGTFEERVTFTIRSREVGVFDNGVHRTVVQKLPADVPETLVREGTWTLQRSGAFLHVLLKDAYISPLWWDRRDDSGFAEPTEILQVNHRDWDFSVVGLDGPRLSVGDPEDRVVLDRMVDY
jgi:hypothetical protein